MKPLSFSLTANALHKLLVSSARLRHLLLLALVAMLLTGCFSAGKNYNEAKVPQIVKGQTTEGELVRMFGEPSQRTTNSNGGAHLQWTYIESKAKGESFIPYAGAFLGGANSRNKSLFVSLGPDGTVSDFNSSVGGMSSRNMTQDTPN